LLVVPLGENQTHTRQGGFMDGYWQDGKYILVSTLQAKYDAEREKVAKLEGWLKYLFSREGFDREMELEISDYIKEAMEVKP
jgi:hypothetical protein